MIFEKWDRNAEKRLVLGGPHNSLETFQRFLSLLWEIFLNIFQPMGFSTVSLGARSIDGGFSIASPQPRIVLPLQVGQCLYL